MKIINLVHDLVIITALIGGVILMSDADPIGVVIFLLAMIEDNVYKRR
jgi:hypothetical protein